LRFSGGRNDLQHVECVFRRERRFLSGRKALTHVGRAVLPDIALRVFGISRALRFSLRSEENRLRRPIVAQQTHVPFGAIQSYGLQTFLFAVMAAWVEVVEAALD